LNEKEDELSSEETWNILSFADGLMGNGVFQNATTPYLISQRMKEITLNPLQATESTLNRALQSPKESEVILQAFSQDFEIQSQVYKKLLAYLGNMLSFDLTYNCTNIKTSAEYKSPKYQKDLDIVKSFMDRFDYKSEFGTVVKQMLRNEAYFCAPRFDMDKIVLQELPSSPTYTMITGRWDYGLLFSFNMYWFILPGVDLDLYPDFLKNKASEFWKQSGVNKYNPGLSSDTRGSSAWVYWQDIPATEGWVFKKTPEIITRTPPFSGVFLDLIQQPLMRALQKNINMSVASRLIMGQVGKLKDANAKLKDQFDINPKLLGEFLSLVKSGVGESIRVAAAPLDNIQNISFPAENDLYSKFLRTSLASTGVNTSLIFTSDVRPNQMESQLSLNVEEMEMESLYGQFNNFLNYHVNRLTSKYKFNFAFEGTNFFTDRQRRLETQTTLMTNGIVMPQKIAAAIGMSPFAMQAQMEEAKAMGFVDGLTPIVSAFQQSGDSASAGRPAKKDAELSDSGDQQKSNGSNIARGGKSK
jgi:hypothetical protein